VVVIPARWASTRLPGKPLLDVAGVPLVERVRRRVARARLPDRVVVATDDARVCEVVERAGGEVVLTGPCSSGTHRVYQVARDLAADLVVNVQGDQPLVPPEHVDRVVRRLRAGAGIATLAAVLPPAVDPADPAVVKVTRTASGWALDFSRRAIPPGGPWLRHIGIYGFRREALEAAMSLPRSRRERAEDLEQLRWLDGGLPIWVDLVEEGECAAVDTPEQLAALRARLGGAR